MFLSFIVPVYNTEKFLPECLNSLLEQDIPKEEYEIICVNDGSTDGSPDLLREYANTHPNIIVIDQENGGVGSARNTGLAVARGDYIWFVDADDMVHPNVLSSLFGMLKDQSYDRLRIGTYTFAETLSENEKAAIENGTLSVNSHYYDSSVWGCLMKREFCKLYHCGFHYKDISHAEDTLFMYEFVSRHPKTFVFDKPIYLYRKRSNSATTSTDVSVKTSQIYSYLRVAEIMKEYYTVADEENRTAAANIFMTHLWNTLLLVPQMPGDVRADIMCRMKKGGLFPYHRLKECTLTKSYQTTRTDFIGKLFDRLYLNLHRPWGFYGMYLLQRLISFKHHFSN